jgi:Uma2 family endonuclease
MTTAVATEEPTLCVTERYTLADLIDRLGGVSLDRILARPAPGTATEEDLLEAERGCDRIYELVDGVLVEKALAFRESIRALALGALLREFVIPRHLGVITGADGTMRLFPGLIRVPDVAFTSWERLPGGKIPDEPIASVVPDLAIEVISKSNTPGEMKRKRADYFSTGVRMVWEIDPRTRTIAVYRPEGEPIVLESSQSLDGGDILAGFAVEVDRLFAELDREG